MAQSGVVRRTAAPLAFLAAVAAAVAVWNDVLVGAVAAAAASTAGGGGAAVALPVLSLPLSPFTLTAGALGLCLVFRTNTAYARWSDAARLLGSLSRTAINLGRQSATWLSTVAPASRDRVDALTVAFLRSVAADLARYDPADSHAHVTGGLAPADAARIPPTGSGTRTALTLLVLSDAIASAGLPDKQAVAMDSAVGELLVTTGAASRIGAMPIPLSYSRHTSRFLAVWLTALPLALHPVLGGAAAVAVVPVIGFFLLGLDDIGVRIEEGWNALPVDYVLGSAEATIAAFRAAGGGGWRPGAGWGRWERR